MSLLLYAAMTFMGMWAWSYFATGAVAFLIIIIIAALVGGMLYREA